MIWDLFILKLLDSEEKVLYGSLKGSDKHFKNILGVPIILGI